MFDLGTSFRASVERDPDALAIVDGTTRMTYARWYKRISALVAGFDEIGLKPGDHLVTVLQNTWQAATMHWACQFAGVIITPINWRAKADELDFCVENADAKAVVYQDVTADAVVGSREAQARKRIAVSVKPQAGEIAFDQLCNRAAPDALPRADANAGSPRNVALPTSR